jgi:hypothetical protein
MLAMPTDGLPALCAAFLLSPPSRLSISYFWSTDIFRDVLKLEVSESASRADVVSPRRVRIEQPRGCQQPTTERATSFLSYLA